MPRPRELGQPSWPQILQGVIEKGARHIHTALPGRVVAYDAPAQTATVQLVVQLEGETVPPLLEVPVAWPGGAAGFLHVPLASGDHVLVVFSEEDYSRWWVTGSVSSPEIQQRHGLHALAIPGLNPEASPFGATAGHVTLAATAELRLGADGATDPVALEPGVAAVLGDFMSEVATVVAALVDPAAIPTAAKTLFATNVAAILARITAGEMAATKVKAV